MTMMQRMRSEQRSLMAQRPPAVSERVYRVFAWYGRWYLRRHFHAVRLSGPTPVVGEDQPLLVYCNHPAWWDPMVGIQLAEACFAGRTHHAPIEDAALARYRFFEKLGFFGVTPGTRAGAATFLRVGEAVMRSPGRALWVTAEGHFTDARVRPVSLRRGVAHLAARLERGVVLPLALEYAFWSERLPEALARFGDAIDIAEHAGLSRQAWQVMLEHRLEQTMDALAADAMSRDADRFRTLLSGKAGVSIVYDAWRRLMARARGQTYHGEHLPMETDRERD